MSDGRTVRAAALAGAIGGLVNATLCFAEWPRPVPDAHFHWHVIPTGLFHGMSLALIAVVAAIRGRRYSIRARLLALPVVGWVAGYVSWIPLAMSVFNESLGEALLWPNDVFESPWGILVGPFGYFGAVSLLLYAWLAFVPQERAGLHVPAAAAAGAIGSLWWWLGWKPWYFCLLHGGIWGGAVGLALLHSSKRAGSGALRAEE